MPRDVGRSAHFLNLILKSEDTMRPQPLLLLALSGWVCASCATHAPEPLGLAPGTPHISWIIMSGDRENPDRDFICQSDPRNDCVMPASKPDARVFSDVHLYYHGAGAETKYTGTIHLGFFEGSPEAHVIRPTVSVFKNEEISNSSLTDIVSSKPGTYALKFDLMASVVDTGNTHPIRTEVPVVLR